jgi:glycosyltransferase involved in cell wall biosynthesis
MLKISIITTSFNSIKTLKHTIDSVIAQDYPNIEYIIVDGNSNDGTKNLVEQYSSGISKFISEPDNGIYDGLNKGIKLASGDVIGFLHSDDHFAHNNVISQISKSFETDQIIDAVYGDILFFRIVNGDEKKVRVIRSGSFKTPLFKFGMMPPHPTFYARKNVYERFGNFDLSYKISSDFDFLMRVMLLGKIKTIYLSDIFVKMKVGGASTKNLQSNYLLNKEILASCKKQRVYTNYFMIYSKYFYKIFQFFK